MKVNHETELTENRVTSLHPPQLRQQGPPKKSHHAGREQHTQKKFVPAAQYFSLTMHRQVPKCDPPLKKPVGRVLYHRPSTSQLNASNVKRKAADRGRMHHQ